MSLEHIQHPVKGDIILNVDDDGQCPVDHLWELLKPIEEGYDVAGRGVHPRVAGRPLAAVRLVYHAYAGVLRGVFVENRRAPVGRAVVDAYALPF